MSLLSQTADEETLVQEQEIASQEDSRDGGHSNEDVIADKQAARHKDGAHPDNEEVCADDISPHDSASQVASRTSSMSSSSRMRAMARRAALEAEAAALQEQQELELEEMMLRQKKVQLMMRTKLRIATAEEQVYADFVDMKSQVKSCHSVVKQQKVAKPAEKCESTLTYPLSHQEPESSKTSPSEPVKKATSLEPELVQMLHEGQQQQQRLFESMMLPRAELMVYDGNPLTYWEFWRAFENSVDETSVPASVKLNHLFHNCTGEARKVLHGCMVMNPGEGYKQAKFLLRQRFGNSLNITEAWMRKVTEGEKILPHNKVALREMADELRVCQQTLHAMGHKDELSSQTTLVKIIERLPHYLRGRWIRVVSRVRQEYRQPRFEDVVDFIQEVADEVNDPVYGRLMGKMPSNQMTAQPFRKGKDQGTRAYAVNSTPQQDTKTCPLCSMEHTLIRCEKFRDLKPADRFKVAQTKKLCYNCLTPGHMAGRCRVSRTCTVPGCKRKHTKFLHVEEESTNPPMDSSSANQPTVSSNTTGAGGLGRRVALPIVPVRVRAGNGKTYVDTCALLDSGSTSTFCTEEIAKAVGAQGHLQRLKISTLEKADSPTDCMVVSLQVEGTSTGSKINLPRVFTKQDINISSSNLARSEDVSSYKYLDGISFPCMSSTKIGLLIGQDVPEALVPLDSRFGQQGQVYATRTALGWTLNGPLQISEEARAHSSFISNDIALEDQVKKFWSMEGAEFLHSKHSEMSVNDKKVIKMWEDDIYLKDGHYHLPIPLRDDPPKLPNNYNMAEKRLQSLKRRLTKESTLYDKYSHGMAELISEGYAEEVPESAVDSEGPVWYLPHHPVFNPNKPDKTRIVFDCAATQNERSLNSEVRQGPDLTNALVGVLLRFRQHPVAVMADIKAMFHQVRVPPKQCNLLRFLWWKNGDLEQQPKVYRMTVHLFGGTWSPSACSFALRQVSQDNEADFSPAALKAVEHNFYVDDCLISAENEGTAIQLTAELRGLVQRGGFHLTKWTSNNPRVVESVPEEERAKEVKGVDLNHEAMPVERALGVSWNLELDCFEYKMSPKDKPLTRRGMLSIVSSIYDPCGYACPFVLQAKLILQELTAMKLGWDEPIPALLIQRWQRWLDELPRMEGFRVNRCLKPHDLGEVRDYQLHHFSDASEKAYGAASYLRMTSTTGQVHTSLVFAKSRVAPLKKVTIPRLELMAAALSAQLDQMIRRELDLPIGETVYWTDSTIVLQYVKNEDKRFHTFVANRVAIIHGASEPRQWRHVESGFNPADDVSRGLAADDLQSSQRWLQGPDFLQYDKREWPTGPDLKRSTLEKDKEVKDIKPGVFAASDSECNDVMDKLITRCSSWYKLKRKVAWIHRVMRHLRGERQMMKQLVADDLRQAESSILRYVQKGSFPEEHEILEENLKKGEVRPIKKSSSLSKLDPKMTDDGLMRVGGRLRNASLPEQAKHPIILPKKHHVVHLLVRHFHITAAHCGREHVLSLLRQQFWVIRGRVAVRHVLRSCVVCRIMSASPSAQKMGDLPDDRVKAEKPPFTNVGVDCFGPFLVKQGRSQVKRYGCIFTCLVVRAVHIEILHSLETDSFLNGLQRFIARRGQPEVIRSDNGTNFVGADRELREGIQRWNQQKIHDHLLQRGIDWKFNPPTASHMGGSWERQIRTTRKIIGALY